MKDLLTRLAAASIVFLCASFFHREARAQDSLQVRGLYVGIGSGLDAGGIIGARMTYWITPNLSGFIGGGWALVDPGYNGGLEVRFNSRSRTSFFLTGMYGYNGVIKVQGKETLNGIYFGPTAGMGLILRHRYLLNYWRFSFNIPFRSEEMMNDISALKQRTNVEMKQDLLPFTIGIGFHLAL